MKRHEFELKMDGFITGFGVALIFVSAIITIMI